jgi:LPS O-antigen subunit length determinant protein (WzzB/FepE family)
MLYLKFIDILFLLILLLLLLLANKSYLRFFLVNPWDVHQIRNLKHTMIISFAKYTNLRISFSKKKNVFPKLVKRTAKQSLA